MIRKLRVRHRRVTGALAIVLPVAYVAALAARPEFPVSPTSGAAFLERGVPGDAPAGARIDREGGATFVVVTPGPERVEPDLLAYLAPADALEALHERAMLLGAVAAGRVHRFEFPTEQLPRGGATVQLYSLAHAEFVGNFVLVDEEDE